MVVAIDVQTNCGPAYVCVIYCALFGERVCKCVCVPAGVKTVYIIGDGKGPPKGPSNGLGGPWLLIMACAGLCVCEGGSAEAPYNYQWEDTFYIINWGRQKKHTRRHIQRRSSSKTKQHNVCVSITHTLTPTLCCQLGPVSPVTAGAVKCKHSRPALTRAN